MFAVVLCILVVLAGVAVILVVRHRRPQGFMDIVRHPGRWRRSSRARQAWRETIQSETLDDKEMRRLVRDLRHPRRWVAARERLRAQGERALPHLLTVLSDPLYLKRDLPVVLELITPLASPMVVPALLPLVRHDDAEIRKAVALALAGMGTEACTEGVVAALSDPDDSVCSYAMIGIIRGIEAGTADQVFLDGVFESIIPLVDRKSLALSIEPPPRCLLGINRDRAIPILLSDRFFRSENETLYRVLAALVEASVVMPVDGLLRLIEGLRPRLPEFPFNCAYGQALIALAMTRDSRANGLIEEGIRSDGLRVAGDAAQALCALRGADNVDRTVSELYETVGFERLAGPLQVYHLVKVYEAEVNNGGHAQYFFNPYGEHAEKTVQALREIGAQNTVAILEAAVRLFGPEGPRMDWERRQDQLARLGEDKLGELGRLNKQFYKNEDRLRVLLYLYAAEHAEHFRQQEDVRIGTNP